MSTAITAAEKVDGFTRRSMRKAQKQKRSQGSSQFRSQSSQAELFPLPQLKGKFPATRGAAPRLAWGYRCRGGRVTFPGLSRVGGWWSPVVSFWRLLRAAITLGEKHFPRSFPPFNLLFCQRKKKGDSFSFQTLCRTGSCLNISLFSLVSRTLHLIRLSAPV